jgi:Flp pilus assembly protein TadG
VICRPDTGRSRGQALAEFALVAPIFFVILFGIIESGRFIFHYEMLSSATRDGARYAIVHGGTSSNPATADEIEDVVLDSALAIADDGNLVVTTVWPVSNARGETVTVGVAYTYDPIVPLLPPITITAESTLVINH